MKKIYYGYCSYMYGTLFVDQDYNFISCVHENDGNWRSEYFDPIMNHMGITMEYVDWDKILKKAGRKLENGATNPDELDFKSFMNGKA